MNVKLDGIEFVLVITLLSFYSQENNSDILKQISENFLRISQGLPL